MAKIDIVEHLGDTIPLDLTFTSDEGESVALKNYFGKGKPVILVLGYYQCPMLCNLVFNGLTEGVKGLGWTPGDRYEMVMVSINPKETAQLAAAKKANYVKQLGMSEAAAGWHFLVGDSVMSARLAEAIGFKYFYDEQNDQYAHPAAAYILTDQGVISRYLYGIEFSPRDLKLSLLEASDGKIGSTADRLILYCFHYDPSAGSYVLFASNVMKLGGILTLLFLGALIGLLWWRERRRRGANRTLPLPPTANNERTHLHG